MSIPIWLSVIMSRFTMKIKEGNRERIQIFEGTVIARKGKGLSETFTVRRLASGVGVERILLSIRPRSRKLKQFVRDGSEGLNYIICATESVRLLKSRKSSLQRSDSLSGEKCGGETLRFFYVFCRKVMIGYASRYFHIMV